MYTYTVIQWLFFFYFYCFCGWCIESTYVSLHQKRLVNRGFMRGPFLPLYGSGAIMMLVVSMPFQDHLILVYIAGCIGATILEYITGVTMEALFKVRYWDYSDKRFNFQGHICLGTSLSWGLLTILMTQFIHKPVERLVLSIPNTVLTILTLVLTVCIACDFALSFKAAMDLRNILVMLDKAKEELVHIQKRLDVIIALADSDIQNRKEEWTEANEARKAAMAEQKAKFSESVTLKVEDLKTGIESKFSSLKQRALEKPSVYLESIREEVGELRIKYGINMEKREHLGHIRDFYKRNMIRSNPTMTSKVFKDAWEELKGYIEYDPDGEEKKNRKESACDRAETEENE